MSAQSITRVFVYGTLKTGQRRESNWPHPPLEVRSATTQGNLYDLDAYPAMTPGVDIVLGEVWRFELQQMPETLRVLDEIEDYRDADDDLYKRVVVDCSVDGVVERAYTYHYAAALDEQTRVHPLVVDNKQICKWPRNA